MSNTHVNCEQCGETITSGLCDACAAQVTDERDRLSEDLKSARAELAESRQHVLAALTNGNRAIEEAKRLLSKAEALEGQLLALRAIASHFEMGYYPQVSKTTRECHHCFRRSDIGENAYDKHESDCPVVWLRAALKGTTVQAIVDAIEYVRQIAQVEHPVIYVREKDKTLDPKEIVAALDGGSHA